LAKPKVVWRHLLTNIVKEKPMQKRMFVIFMLMLTAVTLAAQSKKLRPGFNLFSKEQDVQLGKESAAEVEKKMKVVDNPELQAYIGTVGKKLTSSADAGEFPYSFKVVIDKSINAFALPAGRCTSTQVSSPQPTTRARWQE
jgi:predicted Zn-dependent protease